MIFLTFLYYIYSISVNFSKEKLTPSEQFTELRAHPQSPYGYNFATEFFNFIDFTTL